VFGGPASNAVVFGTNKFYQANPKTIAAFMAALEEANQLIAKDPAAAAKIYLDATKEKFTVDEIVAMIKAPNVVYSTTPNATMVFADFMVKTGLIKTKPASWKVLLPCRPQLPGHSASGAFFAHPPPTARSPASATQRARRTAPRSVSHPALFSSHTTRLRTRLRRLTR
jgi:hypothetical protein